MAVGWDRLVEVAQGMGPDPVFDDVSDGDLVGGLAAQAGRVAVETARWIALVTELTVRGVWSDAGAKSPGQWLSWKVGLASTTARDHVRVGLALRSLPLVRERFEAGTVSYSKVRAITRVATEDSQELLLAYADSCPANELEKIIARTRRACRVAGVEADPCAENAADPNDRDARVEDVHVRRGEDGAWELVVRLDEVDGARVEQNLDWLARQQDADLPPGVRQALALMDAVAGAMDGAPADTSGEDRDRLVVQAIAVSAPSGDSAESDAPVRSVRLVPRVTAGRAPAMSVRSLQRLACTGSSVTVVTDEHGCPLDVGRSQREATAAQRKALMVRDGRCRFPGCSSTQHLHAHHAVEWGDGGATDLDNLVLVCGFHHRFIHNADWHVKPHGHGVFSFLDARGEVVVARDSAESPGELPVVAPRDVTPRGTVRQGGGLEPRWWDGERIDWDLVVFVLTQQLLRTEHQGPSAFAIAA